MRKLLLSLVIALGFISSAFSQEKVDIITMLNGQEKKGKITKITDATVKFIYTGEELVYDIKKSEIQQIKFSSGRIEVFNKPKNTTNNTLVAKNVDNKLAVLPFSISSNDPAITQESMSGLAQQNCIKVLRDQTTILLDIQDPMTTNALLAQNNISNDQLRSITPKKMAEILGVEYVVYGTLNVVNKGASTTGSNITSYRNKRDRNKRKGLAVTTGTSTTRIVYDERLNLDIYNNLGKNIYSESKRPFASGVEAYNSSLKYLIKRSPFGKKGRR